ncbi:hypothetical protein [Pseudoalteromonas sp. PA2MD11]|uniref:hypothetical protein n=1 Tax=Pseudoalteromonas sp. PA2MD11 TaxID=2785057 RepID=UPI001ADF9620|nr:hypothetical protein [Pseudoalteromonas sp. PA2MD11]
MDAIVKSVPDGHIENQKIRAVKKLILTLKLSQSEMDQLVAELVLDESDLVQLNETVTLGNDFNVVNIAASKKKLGSPVITLLPQEESNSTLKEFIQTFEGQPKVLKGYPGMSIKVSRKEKTIQLRDGGDAQYFKLISYPLEHQFTNEDIKTIIDAHKRFVGRRKAGMPWRERGYLLSGSYRELITFHDLFEFYKESASKKRARAISRIQTRYFSGQWGEKIMANYSIATFRIDYLDRYVSSRCKSDRNEIIKMVKAAINIAKADVSIRINVQELVLKGERSRADKSDKTIPEMSTLAQFIIEAYESGCESLGLKLISQFMASTREANTNKWRWSRVKLDDLYIEVPTPESKTGFRRHPIPKRLVNILSAEKSKQQRDMSVTKGRNSEPLLMFESPYNRGKVDTTLNKQFNDVKASLLAKKEFEGATKEDLKSISSFTQHRIRDLVEQALLDVAASEGQKEKCLGRLPSEQAESYGNLSIEKLSELKDRMVEKAELEYPELKVLFQRLIDKKVG